MVVLSVAEVVREGDEFPWIAWCGQRCCGGRSGEDWDGKSDGGGESDLIFVLVVGAGDHHPRCALIVIEEINLNVLVRWVLQGREHCRYLKIIN